LIKTDFSNKVERDMVIIRKIEGPEIPTDLKKKKKKKGGTSTKMLL
jgi:hypothetical protein